MSSQLVRTAKVYAALSGTFQPKAALPPPDTDPDTLVVVASELAAACDTNPDAGDGWLLRTSERRYIIQTLKETGTLHDAVEERRSKEADEETLDLLSTLEVDRPFRSPK